MINIFTTFENFFKIPLKLIRKRMINVVHIESNTNFILKGAFLNAQINKRNEIQLNVVNSEKAYKLISRAAQKVNNS